MKSTHRRLSRALVALVGMTFALGLVFWLHNLANGKATTAAQAPTSTSEAGVPLPGNAEPQLASSTQPASTQRSPDLLVALADLATTQPTPPQNANKSPVTEARELFDSAKFLEARTLLNDALIANSLSSTDAKQAKQLLNQINQTVVFSARKFPEDPFGGSFTVPPGGALAKIAKSHDIPADLLQRINGISDPRRLQAGQTIKVLKGPFHALVNKTDFTLEIWAGEPMAKGSMYVTSFPVGLGKDDSTPTGNWAVTNRLKNPTYYSPRGQGVIAADDPKNPLGECWIGLTGTDGHAVGKMSYGIHGTIDETSIGKQDSMGCIRLKNADIAVVYDMMVADGKSTVVVKE
jgi:lipoprotein-anchoring transpeptidase ErfK/SrfK